MADQETMVADFVQITGADEERATFYLQAAKWELNIALETFYDHSSDDTSHHTAETYAENPTTRDEEASTIMPPEPEIPARGKQPSGRKEKSNVFSLSSYKEDESGSSDTEEGQAYYAGGSEHSGQQILGPDKHKKKNPTGGLFDAAKKHGASVVSSEEQDESKPNAKKTYFRGAGFKLGSDVEPSQQVSSSLSKDELDSTKREDVVIKFWSNGFSVDNGPLRDFNDPANKVFLDSIAKGGVPAELRQLTHNAEVHVNMEDHREEEYVKPKDTLKAFSGKGQMLGSPTPNIPMETEVSTSPNVPGHQNAVYQVNETKPVTSIQIRLSDGTRLVTKFNHDSTIGDIRNVVRNARPNTGNFNLMTTFPNKVLTDDDVTISDAKLLNAVIVQRMM